MRPMVAMSDAFHLGKKDPRATGAGPPVPAPGLERSVQPQHPPVRRLAGAGTREIVKRLLGHPDDTGGPEISPLARAILGAHAAAFPFHHRPAVITILRKLGEDFAEIHLPVAKAARSRRSAEYALVISNPPRPDMEMESRKPA